MLSKSGLAGTFLHEHPCNATAWQLKCIQDVLALKDVAVTVADLCQYGLKTKDDDGSMAPAKKPTKFMTNSSEIRKRLSRRCPGEHKHVALMSGRAKTAQVYPREFCKEICRGLKDQQREDMKRFAGEMFSLVEIEGEDSEMLAWLPQSVYTGSVEECLAGDDVKGGPLDECLVRAAREEEMEYVRRLGVY